jgi:hypothetical protein
MKLSKDQAFQVLVELIRSNRATLFQPELKAEHSESFSEAADAAAKAARVHAIYINRLLNDLTDGYSDPSKHWPQDSSES